MGYTYEVRDKIRRVHKSRNKLLLARARTRWIKKKEYIHVLNYFYYRYFTNDFELFLLQEAEEKLNEE